MKLSFNDAFCSSLYVSDSSSRSFEARPLLLSYLLLSFTVTSSTPTFRPLEPPVPTVIRDLDSILGLVVGFIERQHPVVFNCPFRLLPNSTMLLNL
jgi:hypothetical protein